MQDQGSGRRQQVPCDDCGGAGWIEHRQPPGRPAEVAEQDWLAKCPTCRGTGRVDVQPELPADPVETDDDGGDDDDDIPF